MGSKGYWGQNVHWGRQGRAAEGVGGGIYIRKLNLTWTRLRHLLISAKMGDNVSLETIKQMFAKGDATKDQYAEALKGCQIAIEEMKSPERDEAQPFFERRKRKVKVE